MLLPGPQPPAGVLGLGTVLLFGVVAIGYFFGELSLATGAVLFVAPLAAWLVELPPLKKRARRPAAASCASCWWAELWPRWYFVPDANLPPTRNRRPTGPAPRIISTTAHNKKSFRTCLPVHCELATAGPRSWHLDIATRSAAQRYKETPAREDRSLRQFRQDFQRFAGILDAADLGHQRLAASKCSSVRPLDSWRALARLGLAAPVERPSPVRPISRPP